MKMKTLIAVAVASAFAVPFAAQASADGDRLIVAQASGGAGAPGGASSGPGTGGAGGAAAQGGTAAQGGSAGAPGGTGAGIPPTDLQQLDTDNDGYISRDEAAKDRSMGSRFSELDKDNDGRISRAEWSAASGTAATGATGADRNPAADTSTAAQQPPQHRGLPGDKK